MDGVKAFLSNVVVQYVAKIGGTAVATGGWLNHEVMMVVAGVVAVVVGIVGHYIQYDTALNTPPPTN